MLTILRFNYNNYFAVVVIISVISYYVFRHLIFFVKNYYYRA